MRPLHCIIHCALACTAHGARARRTWVHGTALRARRAWGGPWGGHGRGGSGHWARCRWAGGGACAPRPHGAAVPWPVPRFARIARSMPRPEPSSHTKSSCTQHTCTCTCTCTCACCASLHMRKYLCPMLYAVVIHAESVCVHMSLEVWRSRADSISICRVTGPVN